MSVEDCKSLKADFDSVQQWCGKNHTKTFRKLKLYISHVRQKVLVLITMSVRFKFAYRRHKRSWCHVSKFQLHCYVVYVHSQTVRTLELIRYITYFPLPQTALLLYTML
jgi:hypothetical protein